jgi:hypothetical protein
LKVCLPKKNLFCIQPHRGELLVVKTASPTAIPAGQYFRRNEDGSRRAKFIRFEIATKRRPDGFFEANILIIAGQKQGALKYFA